MLIHLARLSVITIALALVGGLGFLLHARSGCAPTIITVVVPQTALAQPTVQPTVVYPSIYPYWWSYCGRGVCWHD